jgi:WhiB family transcriptional regulator, redox-sensing transcriptional regulator
MTTGTRVHINKHGTRSRYVHGCRCDACTEANTNYCRGFSSAVQIPPPPHWPDAACRGMDAELWYPSSSATHAELAKPLAICRSCPVQVDCLAHALEHHEVHGIWGGVRERPRRDLRRGLAMGLDPGVVARAYLTLHHT